MWPEVDKDALLNQTSVRLLWTFLSTKPWPWASAFTFSLPYFIKNPTYLDWFRFKPPTPVTWSPSIYDQIPHSSPQPPGDVWSPRPARIRQGIHLEFTRILARILSPRPVKDSDHQNSPESWQGFWSPRPVRILARNSSRILARILSNWFSQKFFLTPNVFS